MKKLAFAFLLVASPALAETAQITVRDANVALNALSAISAGNQRMSKDGAPPAQFDFTPSVKLAIARDIARLRAALRPHIEEMQEIKTRLCPDRDPEKCGAGEMAKLAAAGREIDARALSVDLVMLNESDFSLDRNAISPDVLSGLGAVAPFVK